ncbi:alpha-kinase family-domain-containing protein [Multifurca ochricompacta]|uniref:Alpha-kinase family-domain-containing protein n=2 Tax=Multifurca ochricompacta TaxID=376703 RepID=A0AAD4LWH5_9AGAM|nr:alpha-kinase family-domain-containing protein [Multifurca ochricompacta]
MEIACLVWAHVLLNLVYKFVDKSITSHGVPPFQIPRMCFVEASLAIEHVTSEFDEARAFLLEEVIGGDEGHFRKYLNNVSAAPVSFTNEDDEEQAEFLAFSQHVQYFKTKKMAFVADYQGGNSILSDPQIVTDSALGYIFAEGNVPSSHQSFKTHHQCNRFCKFFQVPTDYDIWESQGSLIHSIDSPAL